MRRVYIRTVPLKLRLTEHQVQFLRTVAPTWGINYSELARRILDDAMQQWIDAGRYDPTPGQEQPESSPTSIDFVRGDSGGVRILFPEGFSPAVQRDVREALKHHVPELKGLLALNGKETG